MCEQSVLSASFLGICLLYVRLFMETVNALNLSCIISFKPLKKLNLAPHMIFYYFLDLLNVTRLFVIDNIFNVSLIIFLYHLTHIMCRLNPYLYVFFLILFFRILHTSFLTLYISHNMMCTYLLILPCVLFIQFCVSAMVNWTRNSLLIIIILLPRIYTSNTRSIIHTDLYRLFAHNNFTSPIYYFPHIYIFPTIIVHTALSLVLYEQ